jgi:hypothetical protein
MASRTKRIKYKRRKTYKHQKGGMTSLRHSYGFVTLPQGTRLYHASINSLCEPPSHKPVLFMTLHPSEWNAEDMHISVIELQRDVQLLFMISFIKGMRIFSALNSLLGKERSNLEKKNYNNIRRWLPHLQTEGLDGWFSSIENGFAVEFAIINNPETLKLISCNLIEYNWKNARYFNGSVIPKEWGTKYQLSPQIIPIKFNLNSRFKPLLEAYIEYTNEQDYNGTSLSIMLKNADITYFNADLNTTIRWV